MHHQCLSTGCFHVSHISLQLCSCFCFYLAGSQSSVFTPVPAFRILEPVCLRALHGEHEKLDMNTETSAVASEITDKEKAESDSQRMGEEECLEPAKKKLKGG